MQSFRTEAIILRRTNYSEADRILQLLTPEHGKVSVIAKGVRRPKSKLAGGLELLAVCDLTAMQGRSDLAVVTSARIQQFFGDILKDYDRMQFAYTAMRAINKAAETVSDPAFYQLLKDTLRFCNMLPINWQLTELWFRLQLAQLLGYGLNVAVAADSQLLDPAKRYNFNTTDMLFEPTEQGDFGANELKLLRIASTHTPETLARIRNIDEALGHTLALARLLHN